MSGAARASVLCRARHSCLRLRSRAAVRLTWPQRVCAVEEHPRLCGGLRVDCAALLIQPAIVVSLMAGHGSGFQERCYRLDLLGLETARERWHVVASVQDSQHDL